MDTALHTALGLTIVVNPAENPHTRSTERCDVQRRWLPTEIPGWFDLSVIYRSIGHLVGLQRGVERGGGVSVEWE